MEPLFRKKRISWFANGGIALAIVAAVLAIVSGFGARLAWWHFGTGFGLLRWSVYIAITAAIVSLVGIFVARPATEKEGLFRSIVGLVIAAPIIVIPLLWLQTARSVPPIHDITTDTENPPMFNAIVPLREHAANPVEYGGTKIAQQQQQAYPDIKPLIVDATPRDVFDAALATARELGWQIVAMEKDDNRIEATDTTFWYGFKDDVVIRITPKNGGSKVDMRSVSRVGKSDVGTNAERIRQFIHLLKHKLKS
ncbi:MAG: DUF1499 domain-containing protein [Gammaproteobacteria bacterium]|jgi:uncharacterized protein (DUF1499 family)